MEKFKCWVLLFFNQFMIFQDKWRNLNVVTGQGSNIKSRTSKPKLTAPSTPVPNQQNATPSVQNVATPKVPTPSQNSAEKDHEAKVPPRYDHFPFPTLYVTLQIQY